MHMHAEVKTRQLYQKFSNFHSEEIMANKLLVVRAYRYA